MGGLSLGYNCGWARLGLTRSGYGPDMATGFGCGNRYRIHRQNTGHNTDRTC